MPLTTADTTLQAADRRCCRILIAIVFAIVWGLITHGTFAGSGDEPHYLIIAHSIAFDGDLDVANNYRDATLIGGGTLAPEAHAIEHSGHVRPVHDIGMPLLFAPVMRIAYSVADRLGEVLPARILNRARLNKALLLRHQLSLFMALLTGLLAREVFLILRSLGGAPRAAFAWALLFAVTPPVLSHAFLFFTEIPAALITLFAFRHLSVQPFTTARAAALAGALVGVLLLIHARNVGFVAGFVLVGLLMWRRRAIPGASLTVFLVAVGIGALARTLATYVLWGSLVTTPHAAFGQVATVGETVRQMFVRATGLLFDREYGLIAYAPLYLLAGPGVLVLWKHRNQIARDAVLLLACYLVPVLLPVTNLHGWTGGWSPAARFLVPSVSLLWIAVYAFWAHAARAGTFIAIALVALQVAIDVYVWQFPKSLWNDGDGVSAFWLSRWLPTWTDAGAALAFGLALVAACVFAYVAFRYATRMSTWST